MMYKRYLPPRIIIDVEATSNRLKALRLAHGFSIQQIQKIMGFNSPVSVYAWENPKKKSIPCLENMDLLARLYGVHVEDLYITTDVTMNHMSFSDSIQETLSKVLSYEEYGNFWRNYKHPVVHYVY